VGADSETGVLANKPQIDYRCSLFTLSPFPTEAGHKDIETCGTIRRVSLPPHKEHRMIKVGVVLCLIISTVAVAGKSRKDIPPAPLPSVVVNAKKVFLPNGGGSDLAYDAFYSQMKTWGKYEIVGSPNDADLIV
jgi:hypothetical protein